MKPIYLIAYFLILSLFPVLGQAVIIDDKNQIDENRYKNIQGDPYLLEEFTPADIIMFNDMKYERILTNFNIYNGDIEVKQDGRHIALLTKNLIKVVFLGVDSITLEKGAFYDIGAPFVRVLYNGNNYKLFEKYECTITDKTIHDVGRNVRIQRFRRASDYLLEIMGKKHNVDINQRDLLKILPANSKDLLKSNKWKIKKVEDLIQLLSAIES